MVEYRLITFLGNRSSFKCCSILWHFEILTWESMGKTKMSTILQTADRRAKRTKIWYSRYYSVHVEHIFDARFLEFGLGSLGAVCKMSNFTFLKFCSSPNFHPVHPNVIPGILILRQFGLLLFGDLPKVKKKSKSWHFHTGPYVAGNFSSISPTTFSLDPTQTFWEYCLPW